MKALKFFALSLLTFNLSCAPKSSVERDLRVVKCDVVEQFMDSGDKSQFPGKVIANQDVNLSFRIAGVIEKVVVNDGEYLNSGDLIAIMDRRDYELQLAATQAEYDAIKDEADRVISLYAQQSVTENDYQKAVNGLKMITAKLESHKNALSDVELRAPFSGHIQKILFDKGEAVSAGMPIATFVSSKSREVVINIPASEYIKRDKIVSATATSEIFPNVVFPLKIKGITPKANLNQLYTTNFIVEPQSGVTPTPGMSVMVNITYSNDEESLMSVPINSIFERSGISYVWVVDQNRVTCREVVIERLTRTGEAILSGGVSAGEYVVSAGINSLNQGDSVRVQERASSSNVGSIL